MRSVYARVFLYHADAEVDRALAIATAVGLATLALLTLWLTAIAPLVGRVLVENGRLAGAAIGLSPRSPGPLRRLVGGVRRH
jgi:hypothetical protein